MKLVKKVINDLNKKYPKYVLDLVVNVLVTENTECHTDKLNEVQYGDNIKSLVVLLATDSYMSYDRIVAFISALTNNVINLSKGTLVNWVTEFSKGIDSEIATIENDLLNGYYIHADDSTIKIDAKNYYQLCICNSKSVLLYAKENKNVDSWKDTILNQYLGIVVKDGTNVYNSLTDKRAQCIAHISRYLKGAYEFSNFKHAVPNKLRTFFFDINNERNELISKGISKFEHDKVKSYIKTYDNLMEEWGKELDGASEVIYKDEINLYKRMKGKHKKEILFFINDFKIPFTNNNAESAQRGIKIKQKVGKFRSTEGAKTYCKIKSFILTLIKRKISIIDSIKKGISTIPVLD